MAVILRTIEIMEIFGINSPATMTKYKTASGCCIGRNAWDAGRFFTWFVDNVLADQIGNDETLTEARRQYWKAKAERERLRADQESGDSISRTGMYTEWASRVGWMRDALRTFEHRLPPLLQGKDRMEMAEVLRDSMEYIAVAFARHGEYTPGAVKELEKLDKWLALTDDQRRAEVKRLIENPKPTQKEISDGMVTGRN